METDLKCTYLCTKTLINKDRISFCKGKYYQGTGNHFIDEYDKLRYISDNVIKNSFKVHSEEDNTNNKVVDNVNHPSHYAQGGIECIDAMEAAYGTQAVIHFCMCNAFKYQWRFKNKNGKEDLLKCQWYQNKLIELQSKLN